MKKIAVLLTLLLLQSESYAGAETQCNITICAAGSKVISYAKKDDPYFACPTKELSEYTNYVLGIIVVSANLTGQMPNISPATGEPEQNGVSKTILDRMRTDAKVTTFDQGAAACKSGKNKIHLTVANNPKDSFSIWVFEDKTKTSFWMPKAHLDLHP